MTHITSKIKNLTQNKTILTTNIYKDTKLISTNHTQTSDTFLSPSGDKTIVIKKLEKSTILELWGKTTLINTCEAPHEEFVNA